MSNSPHLGAASRGVRGAALPVRHPPASMTTVQLQVSTRTTAPYGAVMPRAHAEAGHLHPNSPADLRAPSCFFARIPERPPRSETGTWRMASTSRASYLPQADGLPGPGAYSPLRGKHGRPMHMADQASRTQHVRPSIRPSASSGSLSASQHWPAYAADARPATMGRVTHVTEHRMRTLGDGTTMMLPMPGIGPATAVFRKGETTVLKRYNDMDASRSYAEATAGMRAAERTSTWNAEEGPKSRLPRRITTMRFEYPPPSSCWFMPADENSYRF